MKYGFVGIPIFFIACSFVVFNNDVNNGLHVAASVVLIFLVLVVLVRIICFFFIRSYRAMGNVQCHVFHCTILCIPTQLCSSTRTVGSRSASGSHTGLSCNSVRGGRGIPLWTRPTRRNHDFYFGVFKFIDFIYQFV